MSTNRAMRLNKSKRHVMVIFQLPCSSCSKVSFNIGKEDCTVLMLYSAEWCTDVTWCLIMISCSCSFEGPALALIVRSSSKDLIKNSILAVQNVELIKNFRPVSLYNHSNFLYNPPQSATVMRAPREITKQSGMVSSGVKHNTGVTKWPLFYPV